MCRGHPNTTVQESSKFYMQTMLAVLGMSGGELVIVVVAVLVLFGARKIPEFAKGLGQGIKEFKKASSGEDIADKKPVATKPTTPVA